MFSSWFYKIFNVPLNIPSCGQHFISEAHWLRYKKFRESLGEVGTLSGGKPLPRWKDIRRDVEYVHNTVSRYFVYEPDGKLDNWEVPRPDLNGYIHSDCDGYAGYCKLKLLEQGLDESWLRLTLCWTETEGYHMVLSVCTRDGDYILDNRYPYVIWRWFKLDYTWHYREDGKGSFERLGEDKI